MRISGVPAGAACSVSLYRTTPRPDTLIETRLTEIDANGLAVARFDIALVAPGINVLHCEATWESDFDSDSAGTVVE